MAKDFKVIIHDPARRKHFVELFGTNVVCVKTIAPVEVELPIGRRLVYQLDLDEITPQQRERLAAYLAGGFGLDLAEVERDLERIGCPILADGCTLVVENPWRWLA